MSILDQGPLSLASLYLDPGKHPFTVTVEGKFDSRWSNYRAAEDAAVFRQGFVITPEHEIEMLRRSDINRHGPNRSL
jgi:hypothetical protein